MNKLLVLMLIGGAFAAGLLVPNGLQTAATRQSDPVGGRPGDSAAAQAEAAPDAAAETKSVPYAQIERPLRLEKGDALALGLGLYAEEAGGAALAQRVAALGFATRYVAVQDATGQVWRMLMAGTFQDATEAERNRAILAGQLRGQATPRIVRAPPPQP